MKIRIFTRLSALVLITGFLAGCGMGKKELTVTLDNASSDNLIVTIDDKVKLDMAGWEFVRGFPLNDQEHKFHVETSKGVVIWDTTVSIPEVTNGGDDVFINLAKQPYVKYKSWYYVNDGDETSEDMNTINVDGKEYTYWVELVCPRNQFFFEKETDVIDIEQDFPETIMITGDIASKEKYYRFNDFLGDYSIDTGEETDGEYQPVYLLEYDRNGEISKVQDWDLFQLEKNYFDVSSTGSKGEIPDFILDNYPTSKDELQHLYPIKES